MRFKRFGLAIVAVMTVGLLGLPTAAMGASGTPGAIAGVFGGHTMDGQPIPCVAQSDKVRVCHGDESGSATTDLRLKSFDGTPLALYLTLPPASNPRGSQGYPLIVQSHGWGAPPSGPNDGQYGGPTAVQWALQGYAVLQLTARGWGDSCGTSASRQVDPKACANGYIHLDDYRYEARDVQHAVGLLVDEGIANPRQIGAVGESYGGGVTLELATLKDRVMLPNGRLVPWRSPAGIPLHIAAAAPFASWSDLIYSLEPNGRTRSNGVTPSTGDLSPVGTEKYSITTGLYDVGLSGGYYAPAGTKTPDPVTDWYNELSKGPARDTPKIRAMAQDISKYHSPYYLLDGAFGMEREAPAPLFVSNGFTDDIFPVSEALRYYNLEQKLYPSDPIALFDFDGGHPRGQNKPQDLTRLYKRIESFINYYVKGTTSKPRLGATALTQTCPKTAPSGGPYWAPTFADLHPSYVAYHSAPTQTVLSSAGSLSISETFDPVIGGGACATAPATDQGPGVASYRLPAATGKGYTMLGAPTVTANLSVTGNDAYMAARLLDVDPTTNTETLVARGVYRIDPSAPDGHQTFELNPGAWHFAAGHIPKLELLGQDYPYLRKANTPFSISVSHLHVRLPIHPMTTGS